MPGLVRFLLAMVAMSSSILGFAQKPASPLGEWKGESLCTVKPSACHDEVVVYEITAPAKNKPDMLVWKADKIVNGERQNMGTLDCTAATPQSVKCEIPGK